MHATYLLDAYATTLETTVTDAAGIQVALADTIFYPAGGGQPTDVGVLHGGGRGFHVNRVFKQDGTIWHEVDQGGLAPGMAVRCEIDWQRRYRLMRMHTAAHILSALLCRDTGALITGNQLAPDRSRIDFSLDTLDRDLIDARFAEANAVIGQGIDVGISFMPRFEALKLPGVVKLANALPPNIEELRLVEIPGIDLQADGGTQVKNTREIGGIALAGLENKGKNNRRIYYTLLDTSEVIS